MIFFDSYAIMEIIRGNPNYLKYGEESFLTNTLNLAEVFYSLIKELSEEKSKEIIKKLNLDFIEINDEIAIDSAIFRFKNKNKQMSYADCIGYISATKLGIKFLTGDKEFANLDNVEFVK